MYMNEQTKQAVQKAIDERKKMVEVLNVIIADGKAGRIVNHSQLIKDVKAGKVQVA